MNTSDMEKRENGFWLPFYEHIAKVDTTALLRQQVRLGDQFVGKAKNLNEQLLRVQDRVYTTDGYEWQLGIEQSDWYAGGRSVACLFPFTTELKRSITVFYKGDFSRLDCMEVVNGHVMEIAQRLSKLRRSK